MSMRPSARLGRTVLLLLLLALLALALPLAACGKKGQPSPPADQPNTFPRTYPRE
jgi:predicted small lipoprotein YifL